MSITPSKPMPIQDTLIKEQYVALHPQIRTTQAQIQAQREQIDALKIVIPDGTRALMQQQHTHIRRLLDALETHALEAPACTPAPATTDPEMTAFDPENTEFIIPCGFCSCSSSKLMQIRYQLTSNFY